LALRLGRSRLPELLKAKRLTQAEFARLLGVSEAFISQVIAGLRYFSYPVAANAAYILGCTMEALHERRFE
jgi:transcriptional regulator with XRE-family HTH domain